MLRYIGFAVSEKQTSEDVEELCDDFKDKSRFIELPIRVGDKVFVLMFGRVITFIVERIELDSLEDVPTVRMHHGKHLIWEIELSEVGKTVFLTREEAEAEIRRRK
jgi:hypothetical protein